MVTIKEQNVYICLNCQHIKGIQTLKAPGQVHIIIMYLGIHKKCTHHKNLNFIASQGQGTTDKRISLPCFGQYVVHSRLDIFTRDDKLANTADQSKQMSESWRALAFMLLSDSLRLRPVWNLVLTLF